MTREVAEGEGRRNQAQVTIDWRFTAADVCIKMLVTICSGIPDLLCSFLGVDVITLPDFTFRD